MNPAMSPGMRAASADRERAVDVLKAGFAEGRLTQDEYNERMNRAYASRTYAELMALTADLPAGAMPAAYPMPMYQPPVSTNSLARASLVLGVAEFFTMGLTAIPAIICGHMAKREMRQTGQRGDGLATSGLVLGYMAVIFWGILIVLSIVGAVISATGTPAAPKACPGSSRRVARLRWAAAGRSGLSSRTGCLPARTTAGRRTDAKHKTSHTSTTTSTGFRSACCRSGRHADLKADISQLQPHPYRTYERGIHAETADGGQALPATAARPEHGSTSRHDRDMPLSHTVLNCGYNQHG